MHVHLTEDYAKQPKDQDWERDATGAEACTQCRAEQLTFIKPLSNVDISSLTLEGLNELSAESSLSPARLSEGLAAIALLSSVGVLVHTMYPGGGRTVFPKVQLGVQGPAR